MEKETFIRVIKDNQNLIYKICFTYCQHPENRKDLQQEILMQLWNSFSKFDGRVKVSTWIYRVALNTAISFYRNDWKHTTPKVRLDTSVIALTQVAEDAEQDDRIVMLYRVIDGLNEMDKALILLYLEDTSYKDMADILGLSETNVATKISRIKKYLKEKITHN